MLPVLQTERLPCTLRIFEIATTDTTRCAVLIKATRANDCRAQWFHRRQVAPVIAADPRADAKIGAEVLIHGMTSDNCELSVATFLAHTMSAGAYASCTQFDAKRRLPIVVWGQKGNAPVAPRCPSDKNRLAPEIRPPEALA